MTDFLSDTSARVYAAGHRGMVGSAIVRALEGAGFLSILTRSSSTKLDLRDQAAVNAFFAETQPGYSFSPPPGSAASSQTTPTRPIPSTTATIWSGRT